MMDTKTIERKLLEHNLVTTSPAKHLPPVDGAKILDDMVAVAKKIRAKQRGTIKTVQFEVHPLSMGLLNHCLDRWGFTEAENRAVGVFRFVHGIPVIEEPAIPLGKLKIVKVIYEEPDQEEFIDLVAEISSKDPPMIK